MTCLKGRMSCGTKRPKHISCQTGEYNIMIEKSQQIVWLKVPKLSYQERLNTYHKRELNKLSYQKGLNK